MNASPDEPFHIVTGFLTNLAKHGTAFPDDNAFMALFFTINRRVDLSQLFAKRRDPLHLNADPVRPFVPQVTECLFTYDLSAQDPFRLVF